MLKAQSDSSTNPVVEIYRDEKIRKYPFVMFRCSVPEYKRIIDAKKDFGMSPKEAIEKVFCHRCHGVEINKYGKSH